MKIMVTVDRSRCLGNQLCMGEAPGEFELDAEGYAHPTRSDYIEADLPKLRMAEAICPTNAIKVISE